MGWTGGVAKVYTYINHNYSGKGDCFHYLNQLQITHSMITRETECWSQQCSTKITSEPDKPKYNEELPEQAGPQIELIS